MTKQHERKLTMNDKWWPHTQDQWVTSTQQLKKKKNNNLKGVK